MRKARSHLCGSVTAALLASFAAFALLGVACEGLPSAGAGASTSRTGASLASDDKTSPARSLCEARCAHSIRCDGPRTTECDCGTVRDTGLLRADWTQAQVACLGRSSCTGGDASDVTDCDSEAYRAIGIDPLSLPSVVMRCLERGDTCGGSAVTCRRLAAMSDDARAQASACFDRPCDDYTTCFRDFVAKRVAPEVHAWR
ncbi:MAG: hypothetical protein ACLQVI_38505 [Polyangiaceae bacterium]